MAGSAKSKKGVKTSTDGVSFFEDLQSSSFRIAQEEKSKILKEEIQIDDDLKARLERCIKEHSERVITISEHTSYVAANTKAQELVFANQFFAIVARCFDYANALNVYISFLEKNKKRYIECSPNDFATKELAETTCRSRIEKLLSESSLNELDQEKFKKFLFEKSYRKGKEPINYDQPKPGRFKISCRTDVLRSCLLALLEIPNASSDCIGIIADSLVQDLDLFREIKEKFWRKTEKIEIYRDKSAVDFYKKVLLNTFEYDKGLSKIKGVKDEKSGFWKINGYNIGRDVSKKDRLSNYSTDIKWRTNTGTYCAYLEIKIDPMVKIFFPAYNESYKEKFFLANEKDEFVMYEYEDSPCNASTLPKADSFKKPLQQIFYGAPGTGKSYIINKGPLDIKKGLQGGVENKCVFRTTFHPDYDYAQFVGAYKPQEKHVVENAKVAEGCISTTNPDANAITYIFSAQIFANAYLTAWKKYFDKNINSVDDKDVYLVIEEINRGNCAQIFGDLFQLLDRDENGLSRYSIVADKDFGDWLTKELGADLVSLYNKVVCKESSPLKSLTYLRFPPNLNILATMNTSDQSLFPMDSAFKRRFDWEYVPIRYEAEKDKDGKKKDENWKADEFRIGDDDNFTFNWLHFLKKINADIYKVTESEDKQMGEFFIKPKRDDMKITLDEFRSKVLFYLWDSIYKDYPSEKNFFNINDPENSDSTVTFQRLFKDDEAGEISDNSKKIIRKMLGTLDNAYNAEEYKDFKIFPR